MVSSYDHVFMSMKIVSISAGEISASVVECWTQGRGVAGSRLTALGP